MRAMTPALRFGLWFGLCSSLALLACNSEGGYRPPEDLAAPGEDLAGTAALCGNGTLDSKAGELCDTAIAVGQPGACPPSCPDSTDPCKHSARMGSGCQVRCVETITTMAIPGDQCCPAGATPATDSDCRAAWVDGPERSVCSAGKHHVPVLAAGGDAFALGCVPDGSQNVNATLQVLDATGSVFKSHPLLTMDGYYYNEVQTSYFDGRFQALYQYNCDDDGSWRVGWGWGCIDFREYKSDGTELTPSLVFGQTGHNGHPVLDWNGAGFGVAWISYDVLYSRLIGADRKLVGGDRLANTMIQRDPDRGDGRNSNRTRLNHNGSGYGAFAVFDSKMYFGRLDAAGKQQTPLSRIGSVYAHTFGGNLQSLFTGGVYYLTYYEPTAMKLVFTRVDATGKLLGSTDILGGEFRYPSLLRLGDRFYVFSHDGAQQGQVHVFDAAGKLVTQNPLGAKMIYPQAAYDSVNDRLGVVYQDGDATLKFRRLAHGG